MPHPHAMFPQFYNNEAIGVLSEASRWTISGQLGGDERKHKAPIDVRHLLQGCNQRCTHAGSLRGAFRLDDTCLMTLGELTEQIPNAANAAFYLQAHRDGVIVIDIEPSCPPEVATQLLALPGIDYSELSMSGKGFHLLAALPDNLHDFPLAVTKRVLKEEHGWYEILFDHWITFTRNPIPDRLRYREHSEPLSPAVDVADSMAVSSVAELYATLAAKIITGETAAAGTLHVGPEVRPVPYAEHLIEAAMAKTSDKLRTLQEFNNDVSRWEFSVLGMLNHGMREPIASNITLGTCYTPEDRAWLLYQAALRVLPHRDKHDEMRNRRPYLLDRAAALIAEREADEKPSDE